MKRESICCAVIAPALCGGFAHAGGGADLILPETPYLSIGDSPFETGPGDDFFLEDFEDGMLNTPGVTAFGGEIRMPGDFTDSVDADDGFIDGFGIDGHDYWAFESPDGPMASFVFDADALGGLPTLAGIVWTDGNYEEGTYTVFEAYGASGNLVASATMVFGDLFHRGTTGEDRFMGLSYDGGISSIVVSSNRGRIELDHLQYGGIVPAPGALGLLAASALMAGRSRRRRS